MGETPMLRGKMSPPTPSQILEQIRSHYLARLRQAVADHASDGILTVVPEAALRGHDGKLLRRGQPPMPVRVDLITLVNEQVRDGMTIESETMPGFPPFSLRWKHQLPVDIRPFPWNACSVQITNAADNLAPLMEWFDRWFDAEETLTPGEDGLLGVIHSMTVERPTDGQARLMIDFGSAPIDAFQELIDAIFSVAAQSVEVG
jgi:hypothetical protein